MKKFKISVLITSLIFILSILFLSFALYSVNSNQQSIISSIRNQFPTYAKEREEIINTLRDDIVTRYIYVLPIFLILYGFISFLIVYTLVNYYISAYEKIVEQKDKQQSQFVQDAAHELKTPIFALKSSIDVLKMEDKPTTEDYELYFKNTQYVINNMSALLESLLTLSKSSADFIDNSSIDLSMLLNESIDLIKPKSEKLKVKIKTDIEKEIFFKASSRYMSVVFSNVIDNAIKYSKPDQEVYISLKKIKNKIVFEVQDHGIGIPQSEIKNLTTRFYRATNAYEEGVEGTGLGLATISQIIKAYNGHIEIESKLNRGTTVKIFF